MRNAEEHNQCPTSIIDTSFLAPFYLPESTSTQVEIRLLGQAPGTLHISHWTRTEFASLPARKRRMGELSPQAMRQVMARLEQHITQGAWIVSELALYGSSQHRLNKPGFDETMGNCLI